MFNLNKNYMKRLTSLLLIVGSIFLLSCGSDTKHSNASITVKNDAGLSTGDGLDLVAVGEIIKQSANAEAIEAELNKTGGINNLDLNEDGKVDYINVQEFGEGNVTGFSLTTSLSEGDVQEIATIEIDVNKGTQQADVHIAGNQDMYGSNGHYQSSYNSSNMLLMAYLLRPHSYYYHRPYYPGYYPSHYHSYRSVPRATYQTRTRSVTRTSTVKKSTPSSVASRKSTVKSPNANKSSKTVKKNSVANQTKSKRSLQTANNKASNKGGGFGKKSTTGSKSTGTKSSSSSYKPKSSSSSSSRKSSFGGSSSRRSSSSRSSRRSDSTWKTNIVVIPNALSKVDSLSGYTYNWKIGEFPNEKFTSDLQVGVLAQEVEAIYPTAVFTRVDGKKEVDYVSLIPLLIQAIKEQQAQIEELKRNNHNTLVAK
jgi:hypothetical protein